MSFDNIKLEKGLYTTGKGFTKSLEELDPSENYKGTPLEGLDAYQRQLKRFDIKVTGKDSDTVSKFFQTSDSAALFPEYVSRAVRMGLEQDNVVDKIVAATTNVDGLDYRAIEVISKEEDLVPLEVAEGAHIPEAVIKTKEELTPLKKRGRMLVASYEAVKFQKLDMFTIMLRHIGESIARAQLGDALTALTKDTQNILSAKTSGTLTYADLISLWNEFAPYNMTTMLCSKDIVEKILNLPEFRDANAGLNFHATGSLITPFGAEIVKINDSSYMNMIIAVDNHYALEKVQAGEVMTDFDKLIDRQLERASVTSIAGFSKIFDDAVKIMAV